MRRRRGPRWRCLYCGAGLWSELARPAEGIAQAATGKARVMIHMCGACHGLHLEGTNGLLRKPTAAEGFEIHMEVGNQLERVMRTRFAPAQRPEGTLYFLRREER